jgi:hypothetical protein
MRASDMGMSGTEATLVMTLLLALSLVAAMGMMFKKTLSETAALMRNGQVGTIPRPIASGSSLDG